MDKWLWKSGFKGSDSLLSAHDIKASLIEENTFELDGDCRVPGRGRIVQSDGRVV